MAEKVALDARWREFGAEEWSDALVAAMKLGGVEHFFFVSGSEIAFWQESVAKAQERGWPTPRLACAYGSLLAHVGGGNEIQAGFLNRVMDG